MTGFLSKLLSSVTVLAISSHAMAGDAASLLTDMAKKLSSTNAFSVTMQIRYEALQESGQLIEFSEHRDMILRRPEELRVDVRQSDGDEGGLVINSKTITQFNLSEGVYSQFDRSDGVDGSIRYAVSRLGIRLPLARLLVADLPQALAKKVKSVAFVETLRLGDAPLEHIIAVGPEIDAQFWIREDKLPARIVLTYKNAPGQPRFSADFIDWDLAPEPGPNTFQYLAPPDAEKIPVLVRNLPSAEGKAE